MVDEVKQKQIAVGMVIGHESSHTSFTLYSSLAFLILTVSPTVGSLHTPPINTIMLTQRNAMAHRQARHSKSLFMRTTLTLCSWLRSMPNSSTMPRRRSWS